MCTIETRKKKKLQALYPPCCLIPMLLCIATQLTRYIQIYNYVLFYSDFYMLEGQLSQLNNLVFTNCFLFFFPIFLRLALPPHTYSFLQPRDARRYRIRRTWFQFFELVLQMKHDSDQIRNVVCFPRGGGQFGDNCQFQQLKNKQKSQKEANKKVSASLLGE